LIIHSLFSLDH